MQVEILSAALADLAADLRVARHRHYLIFFTQISDAIRVVRVLHGARDVAGALGFGQI